MKFEIKSRWDDSVLYTADIPDDTPSDMRTHVALEKATTERADLSGADLRDDLKLAGDRAVLCIGPIGSVGRTIFAWITDKGLRIEAGCFFGTRDEFLAILAETHGDNEHAREYKAALTLIDTHVAIWTPAEDVADATASDQAEAA